MKPTDRSYAVDRSEEEWKAALSPEEYAVLRQAGTERPYTGEYTDAKTVGVYACRACGAELFESAPVVSSTPMPVVALAEAAAPQSDPGASDTPVAVPPPGWLADLRRDARRRLEANEADVWEALCRQFEATLIQTALDLTRGRRIEAAQRLGIGRNTITRKIQELGLPD